MITDPKEPPNCKCGAAIYIPANRISIMELEVGL